MCLGVCQSSIIALTNLCCILSVPVFSTKELVPWGQTQFLIHLSTPSTNHSAWQVLFSKQPLSILGKLPYKLLGSNEGATEFQAREGPPESYSFRTLTVPSGVLSRCKYSVNTSDWLILKLLRKINILGRVANLSQFPPNCPGFKMRSSMSGNYSWAWVNQNSWAAQLESHTHTNNINASNYSLS